MEVKISVNDLNDVGDVTGLSKEIFNPVSDEVDKFHNVDDWKNKINNGGILVCARYHESVVGFAMGYPKNEGMHLWMAGVKKNYRGYGVWRKIYNAFYEEVIAKGLKKLSVNTFQKDFPDMYGFLLKEGFEEIKREEYDGGEKSFFEKRWE